MTRILYYGFAERIFGPSLPFPVQLLQTGAALPIGVALISGFGLTQAL
jgi:hypothetical protein